MSKCIVGIDAGGTMTKAALFDLEGRELACSRSANVTIHSHPGWSERDAEVMWNAAANSVRQVLQESGTSASDVAAISVSGYGSGLYLLDREGRSVRPGIVSTDSRSLPIIAEWKAAGHFPDIESAISQYVWAGQSLALIGWLSRHEPEVLNKTHKVSFCKDFLRAQLCGDLSTDPTDAGSAGLLNMETGEYAEDMLETLGLSAWVPKLPEIGPSNEVVGGVSESAAKLTGLLAGTPVVRGTVDMSATALASNVTSFEQMCIIAGTFSIAASLHERPKKNATPMLQFPYPLGAYMAVEGSATSASNLEWIVKNVLSHGGTLPDEIANGLYDRVNEAVASRLDQPSQALFFPYLFGGPDGAPAGLLGLNAQQEFADLMMAVFEGIVFSHKMDIDALLSGSDAAKVEIIRLAGGATRSKHWSGMFADILGFDIEVPQGSELGALGASICAAHAVGAYDTLGEASSKMTDISRHHASNEVRGKAHRAKYPKFKAITKAMAQEWATETQQAVGEVVHA